VPVRNYVIVDRIPWDLVKRMSMDDRRFFTPDYSQEPIIGSNAGGGRMDPREAAMKAAIELGNSPKQTPKQTGWR